MRNITSNSCQRSMGSTSSRCSAPAASPLTEQQRQRDFVRVLFKNCCGKTQTKAIITEHTLHPLARIKLRTERCDSHILECHFLLEASEPSIAVSNPKLLRKPRRNSCWSCVMLPDAKITTPSSRKHASAPPSRTFASKSCGINDNCTTGTGPSAAARQEPATRRDPIHVPRQACRKIQRQPKGLLFDRPT
jgi:hypothetical protein